jgi:hypothetical protein
VLKARWQKRAQKKPAEGEALKAHFVLDHSTKEGRRQSWLFSNLKPQILTTGRQAILATMFLTSSPKADLPKSYSSSFFISCFITFKVLF